MGNLEISGTVAVAPPIKAPFKLNDISDEGLSISDIINSLAKLILKGGAQFQRIAENISGMPESLKGRAEQIGDGFDFLQNVWELTENLLGIANLKKRTQVDADVVVDHSQLPNISR